MKLGRSFVIYLASSVVAGALPLALMPFLTHSLAPAQYGTMVTVLTIAALIGPVASWSTTSFVSVQYFKTDKTEFPALLSSVLLIPLVSTVLLATLFAALAAPLQTWFGVPAGWNIAIPLMAAALLMPQFAQTVLAMRGRAIGYAAFEIGTAALNFAGTILLVFWWQMGWQGRLVALAATSVLMTVLASVWLLRQGLLVARFAPAEVRGALRFGTGGVAHELASQASRLSDRLLIVALIGQAAVGSYAVAVQWSSIMLTVLAAFNRSWTAFLFSTLSRDEPGSAERVVRHSYIVWGAFLLFFVAFNVATPIGYRLLIDPSYHGSEGVVFWLTLGYFFNSIYITFVDYIFYLKRTHLLACITVFNLALNVILSYVLIGRFGAVGAAMAFTLTSFVVMIVTTITSHRLHPMPWFGWRFR